MRWYLEVPLRLHRDRLPVCELDLLAVVAEVAARHGALWSVNDRADVAVVRGVYILVCREPAFLEITFTERGRQAFDKESYAKLRDVLLKAFHEKRYDEGLQSAVEIVRERFAAAADKESKSTDRP